MEQRSNIESLFESLSSKKDKVIQRDSFGRKRVLCEKHDSVPGYPCFWCNVNEKLASHDNKK